MFGYDPQLIFDAWQMPRIDADDVTLRWHRGISEDKRIPRMSSPTGIYNPRGGEYRDMSWGDCMRTIPWTLS